MGNVIARLTGLVAVFIVLFFANQTNAKVWEGFNTYASSSLVSAIDGWASSSPKCLISNMSYHDAPTGVWTQTTGATYGNCVFENNLSFYSVDWQSMIPNYTYDTGQIVFYNKLYSLGTNWESWMVTRDASQVNVIYYDKGGSVVSTNHIDHSTPAGTWLKLEIDFLANGIMLIVDDGDYINVTGTTSNINAFQSFPSTNPLSPGFYFDNFNYENVFASSSVQIIDLPDLDNVRVQVGSEYFNYVNPQICVYDFEPAVECNVRLFYSYGDIGSSVWLMPNTATELADSVDYIASLQNSDQLIASITPTQRSASTTDEYYIFVYDNDLSTSTLYELTVNWVSSSTLNATNASSTSFLKNTLGRIFPFSIIYQIKEIFDKYGAETNTTKLDIKFNDVLPAKYSGYTSNASVLKADLINVNLSIWQTKVYPTLQALIWVICLLLIYLEIKSLGNSDTN